MDSIYQFLQNIGYTHRIHPPLAHMPIGLVVGALLLGLAAWWLKRPNLTAAARYCVLIALVFLVFTALTGYLDWCHYYGGAWLASIEIKLILTGALAVLLVFPVILKMGTKSNLFLYTLCFLTVVGLGYYGGQLVLGGTCTPPAEKPTAGATLYHASCGACHPYGDNIFNHRLPVIGSPKLQNFTVFLAFNRNPKRPDGSRTIMPAFPKDKISDQQMQELYDYIRKVQQRLR